MAQREVSGDVAVPLALFAAEAMTNTYKYAFPPGRDGVITIELVPIDGGKLRLAVSDNGVGFDEATMRNGIGTRLIRTFGQQIGGVATFRSEPDRGTSVAVEFNDPKCESQA